MERYEKHLKMILGLHEVACREDERLFDDWLGRTVSHMVKEYKRLGVLAVGCTYSTFGYIGPSFEPFRGMKMILNPGERWRIFADPWR